MKIRIGQILETSLCDVLFYPSFVVWLSYCNLRCPWCQNSELVFGKGKEIEIEEIVEKIKKYKDFIDFLHVTGGEPTIQSNELKSLLEKVKELGVKTSVNTNATNPKIIEELISKELLDHIAIDVKAPLNEKYEILTGTKIDLNKIVKTLEIVNQLNFVEIRTTFVPNFLNENDLIKIVFDVKKHLKNFFYVVQQFRVVDSILNKEIKWIEISSEKLIEIAKNVKEKTKLKKIWIRTKGFVQEI